MDTKVGALDGHTTSFEASPVGLRIARLGRKGSQRFCLDCSRRTYSRIIWDRLIRLARANLAIRSKSQIDLAGNGTVTYIDPVLCPTRSAQRKELPRSQCRQIKTTSRCLTMSPSATEHRSDPGA